MITTEQKRLVVRVLKPLATRVFCATGAGGGIDPTCSPGEQKEGFKLPDRPLTTPARSPEDLPKNVGRHVIVYDPNMTHEGRADPDGSIKVGPKLLGLELEQQNHVLLHEWVHQTDLEMVALRDSRFWDKLQSGQLWGQPDKNNIVWGPGGDKPNENVVESIIAFVNEPEWLRSKYPGAYDYVQELLAGNASKAE